VVDRVVITLCLVDVFAQDGESRVMRSIDAPVTEGPQGFCSLRPQGIPSVLMTVNFPPESQTEKKWLTERYHVS
jgi:hypothetical protein